jgi:hypothetical protein
MINMKKALTLTSVFCLLAALLVLTFSTCKKDTAKGNTSIIGKWSNKVSGHNDIIGQYEFKSNDSVVFYTYKIDTVSKSVVGYSYKSAGTYKIENATLTMNMVSFANTAGNFVPLAQLVQSNGSATSIYTMAINSQKNMLSLYFTCPPYADCIPSPIIYYRE